MWCLPLSGDVVASQQTFLFCGKMSSREVHRYVAFAEWENMIAGVRARLNLFDPKHAGFLGSFAGNAGGGDGYQWPDFTTPEDAG